MITGDYRHLCCPCKVELRGTILTKMALQKKLRQEKLNTLELDFYNFRKKT